MRLTFAAAMLVVEMMALEPGRLWRRRAAPLVLAALMATSGRAAADRWITEDGAIEAPPGWTVAASQEGLATLANPALALRAVVFGAASCAPLQTVISSRPDFVDGTWTSVSSSVGSRSAAAAARTSSPASASSRCGR